MDDLRFTIEADIANAEALATLTADLRSANDAVLETQASVTGMRATWTDTGVVFDELGADANQLGEDLQGAGESARGAEADIEGLGGSTEETTDSFKKMGAALNNDANNALSTLGVNLGALSNPLTLMASTTQLVIDKTMAYAEEVQKLGRNAGITAEESSILIQVADDARVSYEDLTAASRLLVDQGIQPTIENIAKLSDQYLAIEDPIKRGQFAADHFGRNWQTMTGLLEQGGDALRDSADGVRALGLVMDEEAIAKTERWRASLDNLQDHVDGFIYQIGPPLTDTLAAAGEGLDNLWKLYGIVAVQVEQATGLIDDETASMKAAAVASGDYTAAFHDVAPATDDVTTATEDLNTALTDTVTVTGNNTYAMASFALTMQGVTDAAIEANERGIKEFNNSLDDLKIGMSGAVGNELKDFEQKQKDLRDRAKELTDRVYELSQKQYLTPAQKEELASARAELLENNEAYKQNADEHTLASHRILFNIIEQKLAIDGLSTDEGKALITLAEKWGLVDKASADFATGVVDAIDTANQSGDWEGFVSNVDALGSHIASIPRSVTVAFNATYSGFNNAPAAYGAEPEGGEGTQTTGPEDTFTNNVGGGTTTGGDVFSPNNSRTSTTEPSKGDTIVLNFAPGSVVIYAQPGAGVGETFLTDVVRKAKSYGNANPG